MNWAQYESARSTLGWTHQHTARMIGVSPRTVYRTLSKPAARLLRLLVLVKLTESNRKFDQVLAELEKQ